MNTDKTEIHFNMQEVEAPTFEPIPEGTYKLSVKNAEVKIAKSSGAPYINLLLQVIDHDSFNGRTLFDTLAFASEEAKRVTKGKLIVLAPDLAESTSLSPTQAAQSLIGKEFVTKVYIEDEDPAYPPKNVTGFYKQVS